MFRKIFTAVPVAICCVAMLSCKWPGEEIPRAVPVRFPKPTPPDGARRDPKKAGVILMVNTEGKFVVIDSGMWAPPLAGMALKCLRDGAETGVVAVGPERRGGHVIADIVTGTPRKGDQVFQ